MLVQVDCGGRKLEKGKEIREKHRTNVEDRRRRQSSGAVWLAANPECCINLIDKSSGKARRVTNPRRQLP